MGNVGWIVREGDTLGVRLASEVISEGKANMKLSLVGFLKGWALDFHHIEGWLLSQWGKISSRMRLLGPSTVWLELQSEAEVTQILHSAAASLDSPFRELRAMDGGPG